MALNHTRVEGSWRWKVHLTNEGVAIMPSNPAFQGFTPTTDDVRTWLDNEYPEGDVVVYHTARCDYSSCGDECVGGCIVATSN